MNKRKIYLDVLSGEFHANFLGNNIRSFTRRMSLLPGEIIINHNQDTTNLIVQLIDQYNNILYLDKIEIIDNNSIKLSVLNTENTATLKLLFFEDSCNLSTEEIYDTEIKCLGFVTQIKCLGFDTEIKCLEFNTQIKCIEFNTQIKCA